MARLAVGARAQHRHALGRTGSRRCCAAGRAANGAGVPVVLDPVGAGATRLPHGDGASGSSSELELAVVRGNSAEIATLAGRQAEIRGVEAVGEGGGPELARAGGAGRSAVSPRSPGRSTTSRTASACRDRQRPRAAGDRHRHRLHGHRDHRLLPRRPSGEPARGGGRGARRVRRRRRGCGRAGPKPGSFHVALYDALYALDPATLDARAKVDVKLHAIVEDLETARLAVEGGATVVQLRVKAPTDELVAGRPRLPRSAGDLRRQRRRRGGARARRRRRPPRPGRRRGRAAPAAPGFCSAPRRRRSPRRVTPRAGRRYIGAGPGLGDAVEARRRPADRARRAGARSARRSRVPVVAIGGVDASNAADCIRAGAAGVAVVRAAQDAAALRAAVDAAL